MEKHKIGIIGGGAAGLTAAVTCSHILNKRKTGEAANGAETQGLQIIVLEKLNRAGRKITAAGNGRCNMSNVACPDWPETEVFFNSIGLYTREEQGRVYPHSEDGRDVTKALVNAATAAGVEIRTEFTVTSIAKADEGFLIKSSEGEEIFCEKVLIACGGKAGPKFGTTGDGYKWAQALGHSVTALRPVLTSVVTEEDIKAMGLSGLRQKARVTLLCDGNPIHEAAGEVQFTDYGISGICVFDISGLMKLDGGDRAQGLKHYTISVDFVPEMPREELADILDRDIRHGRDCLASWIKEPLARAIYEGVGQAGNNESAEAMALAGALKSFRLQPKDLKGWDYAQVTGGGIPLDQVNPETQESLLMPGLYLAGEILDYDGPSGGFNLQHAWTTGIRAGKSLASVIE